ncbi:transporter substrate-binding domain-containing protein [Variovorax sp. LjRoot290]|uniref:transporter substrate-binding domain-containing protein n=1 Tax=Variovorax sp. LjRoot290 TaxID=3342316 RepID=UPI003ECE4E67
MIKTLIAAAGLALCAGVAAQSLDGTLKKIKDTGTITVATRGASIPFNYLDDNNKQTGFAWDISQRVVEQVKKDLKLARLEVKTLEVTPQTRIPLVANQTVDLECSSTTNNVERQNQVSFSTTFFVVGARLLVRKNSGIKHWSDLVGKNVVVSAGTTAERMLRRLNEQNKWGINIILAKDINENFLTVETGRAVAATQDDIILFSNIARARNPADWEVVGVPQQKEAYGCMLRKGDVAFKKLVDNVIVGMMRSGEFTSLYDKYFLRPIAVKGSVTVNFPMSPEMQQLIRNPNDQPL